MKALDRFKRGIVVPRKLGVEEGRKAIPGERAYLF